MAALLSTLRDSQDIVKDLEDPGVDPSLIKQQIEAAEVSPKIESLARHELFFWFIQIFCGDVQKLHIFKID